MINILKCFSVEGMTDRQQQRVLMPRLGGKQMWNRTEGKRGWEIIGGATSFTLLLNQISVDGHSYITLNTAIFCTLHHIFILR